MKLTTQEEALELRRAFQKQYPGIASFVDEAARAMPKGWTRSATHDLVKTILGPLARTWQRKDGRCQIGYERGKQKVILGDGESWEAVFRQVFIQPLAARERLREVMREDMAAARAKRAAQATEPAGVTVEGGQS